jgi:hypothetical protein
MPLDPNVQSLMAMLAAAGRPKIWEGRPRPAQFHRASASCGLAAAEATGAPCGAG